MTAEVLACPSCRAPGASGPDAKGEYLCVYCGTRFQRHAATAPLPKPVATQPVVVNVTAPARSPVTAALVVGIVALLIVTLAMGFILTSRSDQQSVTSVTASSPRSHTPPKSVTVPAIPAANQAGSGSAGSVNPTVGVQVDPVAIAPVEPEAPATATFEFHRNQSGYQTSFYALGYVTNTSPFVIDKPKVTAVLLDADGKEVATDFGYAQRDVLGPDERSPIKVLIKDPPAHASVQFEVVARKASYIPPQAEGLRVEPNPPRPAAYGKFNYEVDGKVFNEGSTPAKFVQISVQALDADNKLVGLGETYADGDVLAPGGSARFKSTMMFDEAPHHFEFTLSSRVAN